MLTICTKFFWLVELKCDTYFASIADSRWDANSFTRHISASVEAHSAKYRATGNTRDSNSLFDFLPCRLLLKKRTFWRIVYFYPIFYLLWYVFVYYNLKILFLTFLEELISHSLDWDSIYRFLNFSYFSMGKEIDTINYHFKTCRLCNARCVQWMWLYNWINNAVAFRTECHVPT